MNELEKIKPEEFGLQESEVVTIEQAFMPKIVERDAIKPLYEQLLTQEITPELCQEAKSLRLKLVKIRTAIAEIHKSQKAYFLAAGKFVDAWKNKEILPVTQMEENLEAIEQHYARIEAEKIKALQEERASEMQKFEADFIPSNLGELTDQVWQNFILGTKVAYEQKKEGERLRIEAEEKRIADEKVEQERIRLENECLKNEALTREKELEKERAKAAEEKRKADEALAAEQELARKAAQKAAEEKAALERELAAKAAEEKRKADEALAAEQELARKAAQKAAEEKAALERELAAKAAEEKRKADEALAAEQELARKAAQKAAEEKAALERELAAKAAEEKRKADEALANLQAELLKGDTDKFNDLIHDLENLKTKYTFKSDKNKKKYTDVGIFLEKIIIHIK